MNRLNVFLLRPEETTHTAFFDDGYGSKEKESRVPYNERLDDWIDDILYVIDETADRLQQVYTLEDHVDPGDWQQVHPRAICQLVESEIIVAIDPSDEFMSIVSCLMKEKPTMRSLLSFNQLDGLENLYHIIAEMRIKLSRSTYLNRVFPGKVYDRDALDQGVEQSLRFPCIKETHATSDMFALKTS